jgi:hypothetical protein
MLLAYHKFYEVREILTVGLDKTLDEDEDLDHEFSAKKKEVSMQMIKESDYKNADVLYWLFDTLWIQPVRTYISTRWDVKADSAAFAEALTKWSYLMPRRFFQKLVHLYLKPRLKREISDNWDPRNTDTANRIENWLLPWRSLLGEHEMQAFFIMIKLKITTALSDWRPTDEEDDIAKVLLLPWKGILDP